MAKNKFALSKKHEKLIDIEVNIPTFNELHQYGYHKNGAITDHKGNAENSLMLALKTISKNTQYEDICKNIIEKCENIFEYYDTSKN